MGATPKNFIRAVTSTHTPSATGDSDADLTIGDKYLGILLFATTIYTGTAWTNTIERLTILKDGREWYYRQTNWESLHGELINRLSPANAWAEKFHRENTATAYTANADTATEEQDDSDISNYAYVDFDPLGDDKYIADTKAASRVQLRFDAGDTNAIRFIPVQLIGV